MLKRGVLEGRSNAYNPQILNLWKANMDIQFVLDPYACVMYIINYVGKSQRGMSKLLRQALADSKRGNGSVRQRLQAIANCFLNGSEISAQEICYYLLQMPVCQASKSCVFINTSRPEKRVRMLKPTKTLQELDPQSTDVLCTGLLDKYCARPDSLEDLTLSEFAADYNINSKDPSLEAQHEDDHNTEDQTGNTENRFLLQNGLGSITKRRWSKVIRYVNFNELQDKTEYCREQLMLFHPWRDEDADLININQEATFERYNESINEKRAKFVSECDSAVRDALQQDAAGQNQDEDLLDGIVPIADLDAEELGEAEQGDFQALEDQRERRVDAMEQIGQPARSDEVERFLAPGRIDDSEFEQLLSSLNATQSKYLLHLIHSFKTGNLPVYEFLSGGAGVGKSRLIKVIFQGLIRYFGSIPGANPDDLTVLLCAPTGKAAFNIGGMTLHSALSLPVNQYSGPLPSLGDDTSNTLYTKLHNLKLIIIDEISMVGAKMLNTISTRLGQIFKSKEPFGGISILAVGDLHQLPPVADRFPFETPRMQDAYAELAGPILWRRFRLIELTEIMRQRDDLLFAQTLQSLARGKLTDEQKSLLQSRLVSLDQVPQDALHLFETNQAVSAFNSETLRKMQTDGATSLAMDTCQGDASDTVKANFLDYVKGLSNKISETAGLPSELEFKVDARYMMTINVDTADGLVNGATGRLKLIERSERPNSIPIRVWIQFDDHSVGRNRRDNNKSATRNLGIPNSDTWTPIDRIGRIARRRQGGGNLQILRKQFPLVPAQAITIHKSQGDTYSEVVVHLTKTIKRASLYVALSRAKTARGLYLIGELRLPKEPLASDKVPSEMKRLREESMVRPRIKYLDEHEGHEVKVAFHNVQSLNTHLATTCADTSLMSVDVLCFVETRSVSPNQCRIPRFHCSFERICCPYGTSIYTKPGVICHVEYDNIVRTPQGVLEATTVSIEKDDEKTFLSVIYKSPKLARALLNQCLIDVVNTVPVGARHAIIGDFNVDRMKAEGNSLADFMAQNALHPVLPPDCPTTNGGTQIDQCFSNVVGASGGAGESLISYHKPIWVLL